jgi:hypothetical protein
MGPAATGALPEPIPARAGAGRCGGIWLAFVSVQFLALISFAALRQLRHRLLVAGFGGFEIPAQATFLVGVIASQPFPLAGILDRIQTRARRIKHDAFGER